MTTVIGVRFRTAGKVYFFAPGKYDIHKGDHVVVETARGIEYGTVAGDPQDIEDDKVIKPLKPVIRIANQKDDEQEASNREKEKEAFRICLEKIQKLFCRFSYNLIRYFLQLSFLHWELIALRQL